MSHTFSPKILRAYDIRGVVGKDLHEVDAYWIGRGFGHVLRQANKKTIAVGRDGRLTSEALCSKLIEGLVDAGCDVYAIGLCPSPMLYFAEYHLETDAAMMVTGSHNPSEYNGFKMCFGRGSFYGDDIQNMAKVVQAGDLPKHTGSVQEADVLRAYIDRILKQFPSDFSMNVVWDPGNGAGAHVVSELVKKLPGTHHVINGEVDGTFPAHHPDPTVAANLVQLQDEVKQRGADIGLAFDGDADRIGAVDGQGRIFWGDQILLLLSRDVLKSNPGATIIADVKASNAFFEGAKAQGGKPLMWKTGHSHIKTKMKQTGALLAGEMSGHIFIADDFYGFDDGIYSALRLLKVIHDSGQSPSQTHDALPTTYATEEIRVHCGAEKKFTLTEQLGVALKEQGAAYEDVDGVRANLPQGWWLLRASNTEDDVVIRCEGKDPESLNFVIDSLIEQMQACGFDEASVQKVLQYKPSLVA